MHRTTYLALLPKNPVNATHSFFVKNPVTASISGKAIDSSNFVTGVKITFRLVKYTITQASIILKIRDHSNGIGNKDLFIRKIVVIMTPAANI